MLLATPVLAQEASRDVVSPPEAPDASLAPDLSAAPTEVRPEGTWLVTAFDAWGEGLAEPLRGSTLTVSLLPEGRLEGETGCGTYLGGCTVEGQAIRLGVISKGTDPCGRRRDDEAFALTQALALATTWAASSTGLELLDNEGRVRLTLVRRDEGSLAGDWGVRRFARPDGSLRDVLEGTEVIISFGPDGIVAGDTGCRPFEGQYSGEADLVVIAPIAVIGLPCEGDERRAERRILALLDEVVAWQRDGDTLTLGDGSGSVLLEAVARPAPEAGAIASEDPSAPPQ